MNSEQLCKTKEWTDFKDKLWSELYTIENGYNWIDKDEWISLGCPELPHPKTTGNVIKCAYCGWHGYQTEDTYFCFDHVRPVHAYPGLRFSKSNIVLACNHCNEFKGGTIKSGTISDIISQFKEDIKNGMISGSYIRSNKHIFHTYEKYLRKPNKKYKIVIMDKKPFVCPDWMKN